MLLQHLPDVGAVSAAHGDGHEPFRGHHVLDEHGQVFLEAHVAVGHDADKPAFGVRHGDSADVVGLHQGKRVSHRLVFVDGHRVVDHTAFGTFDLAHFGGLLCNRHILVDHSDAALAGKRNSHRSFGYGVHRSGHYRYVEGDVPGEPGMQVHLPGQDFRVCRNEQYVVECQSFQCNFFFNK